MFDTIQILAIHKDNNSSSTLLYYTSTLLGKPEERHIFKIMVDDTIAYSDPECITCGNEECLYNNAIFSHEAKYYIRECNGPQIPQVELRRTQDNSIETILETNDFLQKTLPTKSLPKIETISIERGEYSKRKKSQTENLSMI